MQSPLQSLEGGFGDPARQSAHAFRAVMDAMACPGTLQTLTGAVPPAPLSPAAGAVLLTLCDTETPLYLAPDFDPADLRAWIAFHTGAPLSTPNDCMFALGRWTDLLPLSQFRIGTSEYPDRSATLIVETEDLSQKGATLKGPGIKDTAQLSLPDVTVFHANHALFPLGLDFMFTCGDALAALPRSTEVIECM
jgi:alpha-D-ribose 1-methylphosphonate 5-triphosphate synthase subunit PhnH